ncbi:MAG: type II toxin-antitoxin system RelE/ParE family toxin [Cyanobacterium sp. T60_A2020_053]|nr:type II toxin-antitoxin system RelE/ParE family toxin [Cyanobacterium sp. T60_A2020_053]
MAYRVVWSLKAVEDVEAIAAYIARDSPSYAAAVVQKILGITQNLASGNGEGRPIPEFDDCHTMEEFAYSYRLIYRCDDDLYTILAVIHGKKLLYLTD